MAYVIQVLADVLIFLELIKSLWNAFSEIGLAWHMDWLTLCEEFHMANRTSEMLPVKCLCLNLYFQKWVLIGYNIVKFNINLGTLQIVSSRMLKGGRNHCWLGIGQEDGYLRWDVKKISRTSRKGKGKVHAFPLRKPFLVTRLCLSLVYSRLHFLKALNLPNDSTNRLWFCLCWEKKREREGERKPNKGYVTMLQI